MAQGAVKPKKSSSAASAGRKARPQPPKKGTRVTKAAKRGSSAAADKMQKKYAAGMVARTEKLLGERAGHLELIGKGRAKKGAEKDGVDKKKGGTRKFG